MRILSDSDYYHGDNKKIEAVLYPSGLWKEIAIQWSIVKNITISVKFLYACYQNLGRSQEREETFLKLRTDTYLSPKY
jgi:hypothetical protein